MAPTSLTDLEAALKPFGAARQSLDENLQRAPVWQSVRHRLGSLAQDLVDTCDWLVDAHTVAATAMDQSTALLSTIPMPPIPPDEMLAPGGPPEAVFEWFRAQPVDVDQLRRDLELSQAATELTRRPNARLGVVYKTVFFVVRALQDALYASYLEASGGRAGQYSSIKRGLEDGKPLRELLKARGSDYPDWFADWRDKRNRVKDGVNFGTTGVPELGVTFNYFDEETRALVADCSGASSIYVSDVVRAVDASTELATRISEVAANAVAGAHASAGGSLLQWPPGAV
jgi:hypothetical protein